jgi:hypothetical protein
VDAGLADGEEGELFFCEVGRRGKGRKTFHHGGHGVHGGRRGKGRGREA